MENSNKQSAATLNQIDNQKPNVPNIDTVLSGHIGGSLNGGMNKTISFKKVMAGERHKEMTIEINMQMLTPLTPAYQKLRGEIKTYFVPNSRIWENAEAYTAQKGGATVSKIAEIPNLGGKVLPYISRATDEQIMIQDTTAWRDTMISSYLPRIGLHALTDTPTSTYDTLPKVSVLPLRGRRAIYNDYERNKEYDEEQLEYKNDTVSDEEWASYLPTSRTNFVANQMRARRNNSYYMNYRTELQGFSEDYPQTDFDGEALTDANKLLTWASWENLFASARSQAENAQLNDWDIIAKIRGSKKLTEGKVQLIGVKQFDINYNAITQNAYNNNENIEEEFRVMGKQGAYSYTYLKMPIYAGFEAVEEGYIHCILHVYADTVYESAFDRMELNVTPFDEYRPDLEGQKDDVIYDLEFGTNVSRTLGLTYNAGRIQGFKRKFTEYFKLPNCINGDMSSQPYYQTDIDASGATSGATNGRGSILRTNDTYQFFIAGGENYYIEGENYPLNIWQDYTDLLINKNLAIKQPISASKTIFGKEGKYAVMGHNQIFYVGEMSLKAQLPMNEEILNNYTKWGEH